MGLCLPCLGDGPQDLPDVEDRRLKLAEAAERRQRVFISRNFKSAFCRREEEKGKNGKTVGQILSSFCRWQTLSGINWF
uniref:Small VCP interacting protein n=1 Tax=Vombatus ursinus TaxID=29139 RepID=A0A4X2L9A0_VOMUR